MNNKIADFKFLRFKVPQKLLRRLYYQDKRIDEKTLDKIRYYRRVLERMANRTQHLISVIDKISLKR